MSRWLRFIARASCVLGACFWVGSGLMAETVTLTPSKDNSIFSDLPDNSNGRGASLFVGQTAGGSRRGLLAFDPLAGGILVGATIQSATLTMFFEQAGSGFAPGQTIALHPLLADWGEGESIGGGGQGVPAAAGDATWNDRFFNTTPWETLGGDFVATPSASLFIAAEGFNDFNTFHTWQSTPALVADVQSWVDAPLCGFGWIVIGNESGSRTAARFTSRDNTFLPDQWPALTIEYTPTGPRLDGDIDFDGDVDREDVAQVVRNLGTSGCVTMNDGDFTTDGAVGLADLAVLQSQIGRPAQAAAAVPEPGSLTLASLILFALLTAHARNFSLSSQH